MKIFMLLLFFSSCLGNNKTIKLKANQLSMPQHSAVVQVPQSYYFSDALIYQYQENGKMEELWLYVNPKTKQILYVPNDDMIVGVISFPNGTYRIFGKTEMGKDTVLLQKVPEVLKKDLPFEKMRRMSSTKTIDQTNIQQKSILCQGYQFKYLKMEGGETIYVTQQIPINSRQIYGFSRLDGDARIKINLDYLNLLKADQTITHIESKGFSLALSNYGPNPYYLNINN